MYLTSELPFYNKFVKDSQLFADFIYKRMIPKNNQEIIEILLVNDTLTKIRNKTKFFGKESTDFSDSTEYLHTNKYAVPLARSLTEKEKNNIMKNIKKLNKKGQIIKKNYLIKDNSITFKYEIFPQLDTKHESFFGNEKLHIFILVRNVGLYILVHRQKGKAISFQPDDRHINQSNPSRNEYIKLIIRYIK